MNPKTEALKARTKKFAIDILDFLDTLPPHGTSLRIALQLSDSATSVAANYRACCRARSRAEFVAKIGLVLEESDESRFWLEIIDERQLGEPRPRQRLLQEADELTAIFVSSNITAREHSTRGRS